MSIITKMIGKVVNLFSNSLSQKELRSDVIHGEAFENISEVARQVASSGMVLLKNDDNIVGVLLKGVDTLYDQRFYQSNITEGSFPRIGLEPRSKDILLSERVARKMDVEVGDRIEMLFVDHDGGVLRDRFQISGLYSTGVDFLDEGYAFTDMRNVARLYDGDNDVVTGYEIWLREGSSASIIFSNVATLSSGNVILFWGIMATSVCTKRIFGSSSSFLLPLGAAAIISAFLSSKYLRTSENASGSVKIS